MSQNIWMIKRNKNKVVGVLITQGEQDPEEEKITNLSMLGYNHGTKSELNSILKAIFK